ncbi:MAG: hypothetical protein NC218_09915 [Acetobacter sp.]|nr:hypothetical protein [Acetobacter sp.]
MQKQILDENMPNLYEVLITLANAYDSKIDASVENYVNSISAVYDERSAIASTKFLSRESKELLKLLIENPEVLQDIQTNALGREIIELSASNSEKLAEFKELIKKIKAGTFNFKFPRK